MPTIKDVAAAAKVSPTTVSLVMNGRGPEHRIPESPIERIRTAMRELGYQPNLSARRLHDKDEHKPVIAFFWPLDYRANLMGYFLSLIQNALKEKGKDCELLVRPYINNRISKSCSELIKNNYTGAIIGAASEKDIRYLESLDLQLPLVLINRESNKFSTSGCDSNKIALQAASLIRQKGYKKIALIQSGTRYMATSRRTEAFLFVCRQFGIQVPDSWIFHGINNPEGGAAAAESLCAQKEKPQMILCESDAMVSGVLYTLHRYGFRVPRDLELLSFATQNPQNTRYLIPSVSTVAMPSDDIVRQAVNALLAQISTGSREPVHIENEARIELHESFTL